MSLPTTWPPSRGGPWRRGRPARCRRAGRRRSAGRSRGVLPSGVPAAGLALVDALAAQQHADRARQDAQVEPERPVSTYQMSSSIRSLHGMRVRPLTCAQPVMPGRTSSRRRWRSVYRSTWSRRSGRGPTRLMSPRSTFQSCGSSSSEVRRSRWPARVMRASPASPPAGARRSAPTSSCAASDVERPPRPAARSAGRAPGAVLAPDQPRRRRPGSGRSATSPRRRRDVDARFTSRPLTACPWRGPSRGDAAP